MNPTNGFSITSSILTRLWIVWVVTASDFYIASISIRAVCVQILDWSLFYFEVQEEHQEHLSSTKIIQSQT